MDLFPQVAPIQLRKLSSYPKVSVLMANYNYGPYIGQAIDSVLTQTYKNLELIICDDGSTDSSQDIVAEYCRHNSNIDLLMKRNGGQASAWNTAFAASTGELIFFLDADDLFCPSKIAFMVDVYQHNPDGGFGIHRVQRVNKHRRPQGVWPRKSLLPTGWHGESILRNGGVLSYMPPASGLSLHRTVAERLFPLPENYPLTSVADQVVTRYAPLLTPVLSDDAILAEHRLHGMNSYGRSKVTAESILREITICEDLWTAQRDFIEKLDSRLTYLLQPVNTSSYLIYLRYIYSRLSRSPSRQCHQRYIDDIKANPKASIVWFWKYSICLPTFLFEGFINLMCNQSLFKEILFKLRNTV